LAAAELVLHQTARYKKGRKKVADDLATALLSFFNLFLKKKEKRARRGGKKT
jgi:hypothetical protein